MRHFVFTHRKKNAPPLVNRWIPFVNEVLFYLPYAERLMTYCRKTYGDIYTIQIRNKRLHIVLDPSSGVQIFREHRTFNFSTIIDHAEMILFGMPTSQAVDPVLRKETLASLNQHILSQKSVDILTEKFGAHLRSVLSKRLNDLDTDGKLNTDGVVLDMCTFITGVLFECTGKTLFGDTWPSDDSLMSDVITFDEYVPRLVKCYPYIFQRKGILARERILQRLVKLLDQPLVNPSDYVANRKEVRIFWEINSEHTQVAFSKRLYLGGDGEGDAISKFFNLCMYISSWIVLTNLQSSAVPASIWLVAQLSRLSDQKELSSNIQQCVLKERSISESTLFDMNKLLHLPLMKSAFSEMLRLHDDGGSLREIAQDTNITVNNREYHLESGSLVVFPFSCVHKDPDIYENPRKFQIDRFLPKSAEGGDPSKKFEKNGIRVVRPFVPFGGGINQV